MKWKISPKLWSQLLAKSSTQCMLVIPLFVWTQGDTKLYSSSAEDDVEEISAAVPVSSMNNCSWHIVLFERSLWSSEAQLLEEFPSKAEEARQAFSVVNGNFGGSFLSVLVSLLVRSSSAKEIHWLRDHETEDKVLPDGASVTPDLHKVLMVKSGEDGLLDPESVWCPSKDWDTLHPGKSLVDEEQLLLCSLRVAEEKGKNWN